MDNKPATEHDAALLLEFLKVYQTLPWHKRQIVHFWLWWGSTRKRLPGCMRSAMSKLTGPRVATAAVVLALALYLVIGAEVNYSPDLVRVLASVGAIIGAGLGKAFA